MTDERTHHITFRVDPLDSDDIESASGPTGREEADRAFRRSLYREFGLKLFSVAWAESPLDAELAHRITDRLRGLADAGVARFGEVQLFETITPLEPFAWYQMVGGDTGYDGDFDPWDYISCRAYHFTPPPHFLGDHFGSERFLEVVHTHGLTGLETLWVEDRGRYHAPMQWYCLIATQPIGHGLDHEAFDRDRAQHRTAEFLAGDRSADSRADDQFPDEDLDRVEFRAHHTIADALNPLFFSGQRTVGHADLTEDWTMGSDAIDALIRLALEQGSHFSLTATNPSFLAGHTPDTDFAYGWSEPDGPNADGEWTRFRSMFCSRRARDILIRERVMVPRDFTGALVVSAPPDGVRDLDAGAECPPPFRTDEELTALRVEETRRRAKHRATEKPVRQPDLKRSISALRRARRDRPDDFLKAVTAKSLPALLRGLPTSLPRTWQQVLRVARGGEFGVNDVSCFVPDPTELAEFHASFHGFEVAAADDAPTNRFYFARTDTGDGFAFELPHPLADIDAHADYHDFPVLLVDHETGGIGQRWTGVADFLESIV